MKSINTLRGQKSDLLKIKVGSTDTTVLAASSTVCLQINILWICETDD
jgi:hypothetical protein